MRARAYPLMGVIDGATLWVAGVLVLSCLPGACSEPPPPELPYPESEFFRAVTFDFSSHRRLAPGSDNWPLTWALDGHQYTSWGDGGGFGGTNSEGRVSLGVARIVGDRDDYRGENLFGGRGGRRAATFGGKSYGMLARDGELYMWVLPGSGVANFRRARLHASSDHGLSWRRTEVAFSSEDGFGVPFILQAGKGHRAARDSFVYTYLTNLPSPEEWIVQKPGEIVLARVPGDSMLRPSAYEFFAGFDSRGRPTWRRDPASRTPVFSDPNGVMYSSAIYVPELDRNLIVTNHTERYSGNIGIFEAPEPWGPWSTVLYERGWGEPAIGDNTFYWNFSPKWFGDGGESFVLVFTGEDRNDSWNTVKGRFRLGTRPGRPPP